MPEMAIEYIFLEIKLHTCLSYLSHFGAIFGMPSLTCSFREVTVDGSMYGPSFIVLSKSPSTLS